MTKYFFWQFDIWVWGLKKGFKMIIHSGICIRKIESNVNDVILMFKVDIKGQSIIVFILDRITNNFSSNVTFPVFDVFPYKSPLGTIFFISLGWKSDRSYSLEKHQILFNKINNIQFYFSFFLISDRKIEPLVVPLRVCVILHDKIVLGL